MLSKTISAVMVAAAWIAAAPAVAAEFRPTRPIEFVTHTGPGGGGDVLARFIANAMEKEKLMPVRMQVNNKTGGGGATAMAYLTEKKGETHTIAVFTGLWYTNPIMTPEAKVTMNDLTPIVRLVLEPALVAVRNDSPIKSLKDFIDAALAKPGEMKQSGGSIGSRDWIVRQVLMRHTKANWSFISFPGGGERISALLGGHVNLMVIEPQEAGEHIRAGNMRVIAQVAERRLAAFPNIPTIREAGFDVINVPQVRGIVAPPGLPPEAVRFWEDTFAKLTQTATWKKYLEDNHFESGLMRSAELAKFNNEYMEITRGVLREGGVKVVR